MVMAEQVQDAMHHQVSRVIGERHARGRGLGGAGVIGDRQVPEEERLLPVPGRAGRGRPALEGGPGQDIRRRGLAAKAPVQHGDAGIVTGEQAQFAPRGVEPRGGKRRRCSRFGQGPDPDTVPARILDHRLDQSGGGLSRHRAGRSHRRG